jgi:hypothetical protein
VQDQRTTVTAQQALIGAGAGVIIGAVQCVIVIAGMHRVARTDGLAGIGVAARWALAELLVTLLLLLIVSRVLRLRLWALSAVALMAIDAAALLLTWQHALEVGLHGDARAALLAIVVTIEMSAAAVWWPRRARGQTVSSERSTPPSGHQRGPAR